MGLPSQRVWKSLRSRTWNAGWHRLTPALASMCVCEWGRVGGRTFRGHRPHQAQVLSPPAGCRIGKPLAQPQGERKKGPFMAGLRTRGLCEDLSQNNHTHGTPPTQTQSHRRGLPAVGHRQLQPQAYKRSYDNTSDTHTEKHTPTHCLSGVDRQPGPRRPHRASRPLCVIGTEIHMLKGNTSLEGPAHVWLGSGPGKSKCSRF